MEKLWGGSCKGAYTFIFLQNAHFCANNSTNNFNKINESNEYPRVNTGTKEARNPGASVMNSLRPGGFEKARPIRVLQPPYHRIQTRLFSWGREFLGDQNLEKSLIIIR